MDPTFDIVSAGVSLVLVLAFLVQALREAFRLPARLLPLLCVPLALALVLLTALPPVIQGLGLAAQAALTVGYVKRRM